VPVHDRGAVEILGNLTLLGDADTIVVEGDDQITDLRGLRIPRSVSSLEVIGCVSLTALDGVQYLAGGRLQRLEVTIARIAESFGTAVAALFEAGIGQDRPLIDQLTQLYVSSPTTTRSAEVDGVAQRLVDLGFQVKVSRPAGHVVTARR
jgi:hypothetical protein